MTISRPGLVALCPMLDAVNAQTNIPYFYDKIPRRGSLGEVT